LGIPIKTEKYTEEKQVIRYARLLVEMPIEGPFPNYIEFFNEDEILIWQPVSYEWLPTKCTHCAMLGHTEEVCKKKGVIRTEWRPIQKPSSSPPPVSTTEPATDIAILHQHPQITKPTAADKPIEFTSVSRGGSPKRRPESSAPPLIPHHNSFSVLNVDSELCSQHLEVSLPSTPHVTYS